MRTLVISDLHLGGRGGRDVLRRPAALAALLEALVDVDRLVLLGDVVELLEGRTTSALRDALPTLRRIGEAMEGREVVVVPGNHDHLLIRAWLRARRADELPLGAATRVPRDATEQLAELTAALRPAGGRIRVHYPGTWLGPHVYAHHGHYLDTRLTATPIARLVARAQASETDALGPADAYELARAPSVAAASLVIRDLPEGFEEGVERIGGLARALGKAVMGRDGAQTAAAQARNERIAAVGSVWLDRRLERAGLASLLRVADDLGVLPRAHHVLFGHVHRLGPLTREEALGSWRPDEDGPWLWNSGSWVYEPMLVRPSDTDSPYWPGGALLLQDDRTPQVLRLLRDVPLEDLLPPTEVEDDEEPPAVEAG
ncbi:metallophosphoesterase [Patulibacter sp.]|uniref:metallophosphoesterase n=1 Tax=Patulibacter sp. TaxID=1912859 RepID=UPI0027227582|nr:metallophosphoesterase [Patulibacter sp.]MDO9407032.1 metallophosphoesterase family protein [Patulibacter sp.]